MSKYIVNDFPQYKNLLSLIGDGEENARSMRELSKLCGVSCREFRRMIEVARRDGAIIASSDAGYYIPTCDEELVEYYRRTRYRINTSIDALRPVEEIIDEIMDNLLEVVDHEDA